MKKWEEETREFFWKRNLKRGIMSRSLMMDLIFIFISYFIFHFLFISFIFLFLEQLGLGVISHAVTSVTT